MKIGVLGTGMVGRSLAGRLADLGHKVTVGTRDPQATLARTGVDQLGNPPFVDWQQEHPHVALAAAREAVAQAELLVNATAGVASIFALEAAGVADRHGLVVMDVSNALDFSSAEALPSVALGPNDSLAEQLQRRFPNTRIVKALNTVNCHVMIDPVRVPGEHVAFIAGDDPSAKSIVTGLLGEFGWTGRNVMDLGGLKAARGTEWYMPLWLFIMQTLGTADFNINIVRT